MRLDFKSKIKNELKKRFQLKNRKPVGKIQTRFDKNSSSEIAQKFCSFQVTFTCEQEINIFLVKIIRSLSQGRETIYTSTE